jgi:chemotaxis protein CheX
MPIALAPVLDTAASFALRTALLHAIDAGEKVTVDGVDVERIGLACMQVLAAARTAAERAGTTLIVARASPALIDMVTVAGLGELVAA